MTPGSSESSHSHYDMLSSIVELENVVMPAEAVGRKLIAALHYKSAPSRDSIITQNLHSYHCG